MPVTTAAPGAAAIHALGITWSSQAAIFTSGKHSSARI
jgi:hypothetical protein